MILIRVFNILSDMITIVDVLDNIVDGRPDYIKLYNSVMRL